MGWLDKYQDGGLVPILDGNTEIKNMGLFPEEAMEEMTYADPGITDELLLRQAYKESTFNPKVKNSLGFMGLAQVGEDVISDYKRKNKIKDFDPYNIEHANAIQKWYMNDLYNASFINKPNQTQDVRAAKTLAAYNWGRGNLSKFLTKQKKKGVDIYKSLDWVENLPKETSDYINKILLKKNEKFNQEFDTAIKDSKYKNIVDTYIPQQQKGGWLDKYQEGGNISKKAVVFAEAPFKQKYNLGSDSLPEELEDIRNNLDQINTALVENILTTGKQNDPAWWMIKEQYDKLFKEYSENISNNGDWNTQEKLRRQVAFLKRNLKTRANQLKPITEEKNKERRKLLKKRDSLENAFDISPLNTNERDKTFITEANNLKKFYEKTNPNIQVEVVPFYGDDDLVRGKISVLGPQDEIYLFGHSGGLMGGIPNEDLAQLFNESKVENCYFGSCGFADRAKTFKENMPNKKIHYRPQGSWWGVNPNADNLIDAMWSKRDADDTGIYNLKATIAPPRKGLDYDSKKLGGWLNKYQDGGTVVRDMGLFGDNFSPGSTSNKKNNSNVAKHGKIIEDDRGQWAHPGKITKINSNNITMKGVPYPVLGVSDAGDVQLMQPGKDYQFKGKNVTEIPFAQDGRLIELDDVDLGLVVRSANDPRYKAYRDSLNLYHQSREDLRRGKGYEYLRDELTDKDVQEYFGEKNVSEHIKNLGERNWKAYTTGDPYRRAYEQKWDDSNLVYPGLHLYEYMANDPNVYDQELLKQEFPSDFMPVSFVGGPESDEIPMYAKPKQKVTVIPEKPVSSFTSKTISYTPKTPEESIQPLTKIKGYNISDLKRTDMMRREAHRRSYTRPNNVPYSVKLSEMSPAERKAYLKSINNQKGGWLNKYSNEKDNARVVNDNILSPKILVSPESMRNTGPYKPRHVFVQDNRTAKEREEAIKKAEKIKEAGLSPLQAPLVYMANPLKVVGDFIGSPLENIGAIKTNEFPTSKEDAQRLAHNREFSKDGKEYLSNLFRQGLSYVPDAALNLGAGELGAAALYNNIYKYRKFVNRAQYEAREALKKLPSSAEEFETLKQGIINPDMKFHPPSRFAPESYIRKDLEAGAANLDRVLAEKLHRISSGEGKKRLINQEANNLFKQGIIKNKKLALLQAKKNAEARRRELWYMSNIQGNENKRILKRYDNIPGEKDIRTDIYLAENTAYYNPPDASKIPGSDIAFIKEDLIDGTQHYKAEIIKGEPVYGGNVFIGYGHGKNIPTIEHELAHSLQRGKEMAYDTYLRKNIKTKNSMPIHAEKAYDYFRNSTGQEPTAYAAELRAAMLQRGIIKDYYEEITPDILKKATSSFKKKPMGNISLKDEGLERLTSHRILDFMAETEDNYRHLSKIMNKLPQVAVPLAIGAGAIEAGKQKKKQQTGGWLEKYNK